MKIVQTLMQPENSFSDVNKTKIVFLDDQIQTLQFVVVESLGKIDDLVCGQHTLCMEWELDWLEQQVVRWTIRNIRSGQAVAVWRHRHL